MRTDPVHGAPISREPDLSITSWQQFGPMRRPSSISYANGLNVVVSFASIVFLVNCTAVRCQNNGVGAGPRIGDERIVFQTTLGDIELALYPDVSSNCWHMCLPRDAVIM